MEKKIYEALKRLEEHPFTLIGLSDREKFHTGMLAIAIRYFWEKEDEKDRFNLIETLWGGGIFQNEFQEYPAGNINIEVEKNSVDLIIKNSKGEVKLFAEVKFKTDLHSEQMEKYDKQINTPKKRGDEKATGIILGLFKPTDSSQQGGIKYNSFPKLLAEAFENNSKLLRCDKNVSEQNKNINGLMCLWANYLDMINQVQEYFCKFDDDKSKEIKAIPNYVGCESREKKNHRCFSDLLHSIKLRGIFERYRFALIWKELKNRKVLAIKDKTKEADKDIPLGSIINTHGNAGIHLPIRLPSKDGKLRFSYGVQWQASKLKLFIQDELYPENEKSQKPTVREKLLKGTLIDEFYKYGENVYIDSLKDKDDKPNKRGKFQSITVAADWDIFGDISQKVDELDAMIEFFCDEDRRNKIAEKLGAINSK